MPSRIETRGCPPMTGPYFSSGSTDGSAWAIDQRLRKTPDLADAEEVEGRLRTCLPSSLDALGWPHEQRDVVTLVDVVVPTFVASVVRRAVARRSIPWISFNAMTTRPRALIGFVGLLLTGPLFALVACESRQAVPSATSADHDCVARTLYWEARAEGRDGMVAVGWVVLNRIADSRFSTTACGVVREGGEQPGCQFSYWCDGKGDAPPPGAPWDLARDVAAELFSDPPRDPTGGALFYHSTSLPAVPWAVARERTARIGNHIYYR